MGHESNTGQRVTHTEQPVRQSPSGLHTQYLAWAGTGSAALFVAQQWLGTGQRVFRHTHGVEEVLVFLSGTGEATLDDETVPVGAGTTLVLPAGLVHGFRNTGTGPLHVLVVFPGDTFAQTDLVEPMHDQSALAPDELPGMPPGWVQQATQATNKGIVR